VGTNGGARGNTVQRLVNKRLSGLLVRALADDPTPSRFLKSPATNNGMTPIILKWPACACPAFATQRMAAMRTKTREGATFRQLPEPAVGFTQPLFLQACEAGRLASHAAGRRGAGREAGCCRSDALLTPQAARDCGIARAIVAPTATR